MALGLKLLLCSFEKKGGPLSKAYLQNFQKISRLKDAANVSDLCGLNTAITFSEGR